MLANKKPSPNIYFNVRQPSSFPDNRGVSLAAIGFDKFRNRPDGNRRRRDTVVIDQGHFPA